MEKYILILLLIVLLPFGAYSQEDDYQEDEEYYGDFEEGKNIGLRPILSIQYNVPLGEIFSTVYNSGIGYVIGLEYKINKNIGIGIQTNFQRFTSVDQSRPFTYAIENIPALGFLSYYFYKKDLKYVPFIGMKLGVANYNAITYERIQNSRTRVRTDKINTYLTVIPNIGIESNFSKNLYWSLSGRYDYISVNNNFNQYISINGTISYEF